jgi:hypothetical protein
VFDNRTYGSEGRRPVIIMDELWGAHHNSSCGEQIVVVSRALKCSRLRAVRLNGFP